MTPFWILGAFGLGMLIELYLMERATKRGYDRGLEEGKRRGRLEGEIWWLDQGMEVQKEREKIWREE